MQAESKREDRKKAKCLRKREREAEENADAGREKQRETQEETETQRSTDRRSQEARLVRENHREPGAQLDGGTGRARDERAKYRFPPAQTQLESQKIGKASAIELK